MPTGDIRSQIDGIWNSFWPGGISNPLEHVRRRLRMLVPIIETHRREPLYTNFQDQIGQEVDVQFRELATAGEFERFRRTTRTFLADHHGDAAIEKIRHNRPISAADISALQRVLVDSGVGSDADVDRAREEAGSFGLFVRRLVGLDRAAAKDAFAGFLDDKRYNANQIEFVNLVIDELTQNGVIEPRRFYESPFTDLSPQGPDALFESGDVDRLLDVVAEVRRRAEAA